MRHVHFELTPSGRHCRVLVDGVELKGVRAITVSADVDAPTLVTLELIALQVTVSGQPGTLQTKGLES